jgi:hypothetical protein
MTITTFRDKEIVMRKFLHARSLKGANIVDYAPITDYMKSTAATLLYDIPKTGHYDSPHYPYNRTYYYCDADAKTYVEWLISVISDTEDTPISTELYEKAINQLYKFLFVFSGTMTSKVSLLEPYSIDEYLGEFKQSVEVLDKKVDCMNNKIMDALEKILNWKNTYDPYLIELKAERNAASRLEKSLKGGQDGKKGNS